MHGEDKVVKTSLILLACVTVFVYVIFYQWKRSSIQAGFQTTGATLDSTQSGMDDLTNSDITAGYSGSDLKLTEDSATGTSIPTSGTSYTQPSTTVTGSPKTSTEDLFKDMQISDSSSGQSSVGSQEDEGKKLLPHTQEFVGKVDVFETLGLKLHYILKDAKNIYFGNLGICPSDLATTVKKLGGNTVEIKTEKDIIKNNLFGDRIVFVNLPDYKNALVVFMVHVEDECWILRIPFGTYHDSKNYLRKIFIH